RVEPEPTLRREVRLHADVRDQETILVNFSFERQAQNSADATVGSVGSQCILRAKVVRAVRRFHPKRNSSAVLLCADYAAPPSQISSQFHRPFDQVLLKIRLLQVDESGHLVPRFRQKIEAV